MQSLLAGWSRPKKKTLYIRISSILVTHTDDGELKFVRYCFMFLRQEALYLFVFLLMMETELFQSKIKILLEIGGIDNTGAAGGVDNTGTAFIFHDEGATALKNESKRLEVSCVYRQ